MRIVRVLIAEDNADHLFLATVAFQAIQGVKVELIPCTDGQEAIDYLTGAGKHADREVPDLVLLDLSMPRKDGLAVLEEVRADPQLRNLPIVVLTSSSRPEDIDGAYERGANSYVNKSVGVGQVAEYWTKVADLPTTVGE